jgi:hypothetical protein
MFLFADGRRQAMARINYRFGRQSKQHIIDAVHQGVIVAPRQVVTPDPLPI